MFNTKCIILSSCFILFLSIYITILFQLKNFNEKEVQNSDFYSSVNCNSNAGRCRFKNLCYKVDNQEFVFILNEERSLLVNLTEDRFSPSLQYLSSIEHNNFYFNYVDIDYSDYKKLLSNYKVIFIKDQTQIISRFKPDNLMHSIHDDLLPLYHTLNLKQFNSKESLSKLRFNLFIFDSYFKIENDYFSRNLYLTIFKNVNLFYKHDFKAKDQLICFEDVEIGLERATLWYDYGFGRFQALIDKTVNEKQLIKFYTNEIRNLAIKKLICTEHYAVLLSRTRSRLILNEDELLKQLGEAFDYKVIRIDLDNELDNSLESLIKLLSCTKLMLGMHGAGLVLAMFLPKNSNLIELFPYKIIPSYYEPYKQLARIYDLNYFSWSNKVKSNSFYNLKYLKEEIKGKLYKDEYVEQSFCCEEPYFMFRVYQDTVVDIEEINQILAKVKQSQLTSQESIVIAPSSVGINCLKTNQTLILNWTKPWNLIDFTSIQYDVLINLNSISNMYTTKFNQLTFNISDSNEKDRFLIWIRVKNNNLIGPFNGKPVSC